MRAWRLLFFSLLNKTKGDFMKSILGSSQMNARSYLLGALCLASLFAAQPAAARSSSEDEPSPVSRPAREARAERQAAPTRVYDSSLFRLTEITSVRDPVEGGYRVTVTGEGANPNEDLEVLNRSGNFCEVSSAPKTVTRRGSNFSIGFRTLTNFPQPTSCSYAVKNSGISSNALSVVMTVYTGPYLNIGAQVTIDKNGYRFAQGQLNVNLDWVQGSSGVASSPSDIGGDLAMSYLKILTKRLSSRFIEMSCSANGYDITGQYRYVRKTFSVDIDSYRDQFPGEDSYITRCDLKFP